jgi:tetratricopeptide (TPR) repeat protein
VDLGRMLAAEGYWHQAVDVLVKIPRDRDGFPVVPETDQQLALAYLKGGQADKALAAANRAVNNPRPTPDAFLVRASLLLQLGELNDPRQAVEDALVALQLAHNTVMADPADDQNWRKLGGWRQGASSVCEALKNLARTTPLDPVIQLRLANLITVLGDLTRTLYRYEAVNLLSNAARNENAPVELLTILAERQKDIGQAALAVKTAERILQRDPTNATAQKIKDTAGKSEPG